MKLKRFAMMAWTFAEPCLACVSSKPLLMLLSFKAGTVQESWGVSRSHPGFSDNSGHLPEGTSGLLHCFGVLVQANRHACVMRSSWHVPTQTLSRPNFLGGHTLREGVNSARKAACNIFRDPAEPGKTWQPKYTRAMLITKGYKRSFKS